MGVAAGCGGSGDSEGEASTSAREGATPAATGAVPTRSETRGVEDAGDTYLELVATKNDAVAVASQRFETAQLDGDLSAAAAAMNDFGQANRDFAQSLASTSWPEPVDGDVTILLGAATDEAEAADAYADSIRAFDDGEASAADTEAQARRVFEATSATLTAAAPVRETLGLPPPPGG